MEGRDRRVRAVSFRLRREPEDDDAGHQAAEADDDRQHPRSSGVGDGFGAFAER